MILYWFRTYAICDRWPFWYMNFIASAKIQRAKTLNEFHMQNVNLNETQTCVLLSIIMGNGCCFTFCIVNNSFYIHFVYYYFVLYHEIRQHRNSQTSSHNYMQVESSVSLVFNYIFCCRLFMLNTQSSETYCEQ